VKRDLPGFAFLYFCIIYLGHSGSAAALFMILHEGFERLASWLAIHFMKSPEKEGRAHERCPRLISTSYRQTRFANSCSGHRSSSYGSFGLDILPDSGIIQLPDKGTSLNREEALVASKITRRSGPLSSTQDPFDPRDRLPTQTKHFNQSCARFRHTPTSEI
jgi:hypothetical protein